MQAGGDFMLEDIAWFNGGLFEVIEPIPLGASEAKALLAASDMNWSHIEPSIFGTMFERGLDPAMRSQLGANYTDPGTISKIIDPVIVRPLAAEWSAAKAIIAELMVKYRAGGRGSQSAYKTAQETFLRFVERLKNFRVLDPACGSGNFLYLALRALKDLEHRANLDAEALGLHRQLTIETSPANVLGIEINAYAAELARVTVWIGEIQWMLKHGYDIQRRPILAALNHIECRDAILKDDGTEAEWPEADVIIGNPPFLGDKKMLGELGVDYVSRIRRTYKDRVPGGADLVTYWFEKARAQVVNKVGRAAGLVATNSIRGGANRRVLDRIATDTRIFDAWSNEPWVNEGAAVRVSLVCFGNGKVSAMLDDRPTENINSDLTPSRGVDLTTAKALDENRGIAFIGTQKSGPFDISGKQAREWLPLPNPGPQRNVEVVKPWANGIDLTRRPQDKWVIDFGVSMSSAAAALYEKPYEYALTNVKPMRDSVRREGHQRYWWRHGESRSGMRSALVGLSRYIGTPRVAKHRVFAWLNPSVLPDCQIVVMARADDVTFGVLHSRFHELWSLRLGTSLEDRPRYTPTTSFETYPFPDGLTPDLEPNAFTNSAATAIDAAAIELNELREGWLNPPQWIERVPEVVRGFPDRFVAKPSHEAELKKRTLTNLYNDRPAWLDNAHKALDMAVAQAYGWTDYTAAMPDEEILRRLLALNRTRS